MDYTVISPATVTISERAKIGRGAVIYPNNVILGDSTVGVGAVLYPGNVITDSIVGENSELTASVLEGAKTGASCKVGPFAHLRPGAEIGEGCRIGNFVEIKNAAGGAGSKISHLGYVGDARVGENVNIGCGVVFCNFDGRSKHFTEVGSGAFIGSNANLVAPVRIGAGSYVAAGTTVTRDVPPHSFIIGRMRQESSERLKEKYLQSD